MEKRDLSKQVSLYLIMILLTKSDALNIYKYLYHYQDLMRENISIDDGDELSQIHRRLHHSIMESYPDLRDEETQTELIDEKILLRLPNLAIKTPTGDDGTLKFLSRNVGLIDDVIAVIIDVNGDEFAIDGLKSIILRDSHILLKDDDDEIHEFKLTKSNKRWFSALGRESEKFISKGKQ